MHIKTCVYSILCNEVKELIFFITNLNKHGFMDSIHLNMLYGFFFKQVFLASILYRAYAQQYLPKLN
jgi:hypothetical protein